MIHVNYDIKGPEVGRYARHGVAHVGLDKPMSPPLDENLRHVVDTFVIHVGLGRLLETGRAPTHAWIGRHDAFTPEIIIGYESRYNGVILPDTAVSIEDSATKLVIEGKPPYTDRIWTVGRKGFEIRSVAGLETSN